MKLGFHAGMLLATWTSVASAGGRTRKIAIESDPPGATVYLDSVDKPAVCSATPCTIDAPIGTSVVILRKEGYEPEFGQLSIPKRGKIRPFKASLEGNFGTLVIDDPRFTGATITIDDVNRGVAPKRIDVDPKSHEVVVALNSKQLFAGKVTVETGSTVSIEADKPGPIPKPAAEPSQVQPPPQRRAPVSVPAARPKPPPKGGVAVGVVFDVNFRQFRYRNARSSLPTQAENGQDMVGPMLELWPMQWFGASRLRGLSIYGKLEFGVNHLDVIDDSTGMTTGAKTKWRNFEVGLRHAWRVGRVAVVPSAGFVRDQMGYQGNASTLPIGDYQSIRAGLGAGVRLAQSFAIHSAAEGRLAIHSGPLSARFGGADVYGGRVALGATARVGPIFLGLEGSVLYYRWTFSESSMAAGARDLVESISVFAGAQY